jgi:hypothetical protein
MFEVFLRRLRYIRDIPLELTDDAVAAGELRQGVVVGVDVFALAAFGENVFLELRITDDGQAKLLRPGSLLPLEGSGGVYVFAGTWRDYLGSQQSYATQDTGEDSKTQDGLCGRPRAIGI